MEISLENVTKVYDNGVRALSNLSLTINSGELLAVVGASGCGKTTALRLIAGLETPTEGTIRMGARVVNSLPARKRNVGMVFQRPALYPQRTVRGNLQIGRELRQPWRRLRGLFPWFSPNGDPDVVSQTQAIDETVRKLGLEHELERLPG